MSKRYYFFICSAILILGLFYGLFYGSFYGSFWSFPLSFKSGRAEPLRQNEREAFFSFKLVTAEEEFTSNQVFPVLNNETDRELILRSYRNPVLREDVLAFFIGMTGSAEVAEAILHNASACNIPPALAFSLCAEESGFNPRAFNRNKNDTVDRGLFQLNSASFPKLKLEDFYNSAVNARYGLSHLRLCLDTAGTDVAGLAMYNAGVTRVYTIGTPKPTLDYVSRILIRQQKIEELFKIEYKRVVQIKIAERENLKTKEKPPFRLSLLTPLGWREKL